MGEGHANHLLEFRHIGLSHLDRQAPNPGSSRTCHRTYESDMAIVASGFVGVTDPTLTAYSR